jgi:preprotein translocase subunit SecG
LEKVVLVVHLLIAVAMVAVILLQRSEGGGLGMGGGSGAMMTVRGTANLLTRATGVLAGCFMVTSLVLAILSGGGATQRVIIDEAPPAATDAPAPDAAPTVPLGD